LNNRIKLAGVYNHPKQEAIYIGFLTVFCFYFYWSQFVQSAENKYKTLGKLGIFQLFQSNTVTIYHNAQNRDFITYAKPDGEIIIYNGEGNNRTELQNPQGQWKTGTWRVENDKLCIADPTEVCGAVTINKNTREVWWQLTPQIRLQVTNMQAGDVHNIQNVRQFYNLSEANTLTNQFVFLRTKHTGIVFEDTKPLVAGDNLFAGKVIGFQKGQFGNPDGYVIEIQNSANLELRTYSQTEKELRFNPKSGCVDDICPHTFLFISLDRLIKAEDFSQLLKRIDAEQNSETLWKAIEAQTGLSVNEQGVVKMPQTLDQTLVFNNAKTPATTLKQYAEETQQSQNSQANQNIQSLILDRTVEFKHLPNGPYVQAYFSSNGKAYSYYHDGIGLDNPRSGLWHHGFWKVQNGQLCFWMHEWTCTHFQYSSNRETPFSFTDQVNNIRWDVTAQADGNAQSLNNPEVLYNYETWHRRIGQDILFRTNGNRATNSATETIRNGSEIYEGEIIGFRDQFDQYNPAGFIVRLKSRRLVQVYQAPEDELVIGFPAKPICELPDCGAHLVFMILPQEITHQDLNSVLIQAYRQRRGDQKWQNVKLATSAILLGGFVYSQLSTHPTKGKSHSVLDDLNDILADRLRRFDEELKAKVREAETRFRKAKADFEADIKGTKQSFEDWLKQKAKTQKTSSDTEQSSTSSNAEPAVDPYLLGFDEPDFNSDNPFEVLGLKPNASKSEIKTKWRKLVKRYHPDLQSGDAAKKESEAIIKKINAAYEQLK